MRISDWSSDVCSSDLDDDRERSVDQRQKGRERQEGGEARRHAAPFEPFEYRHQRDGDDDGCGQRQEEFGPRLKGKRQAQTEGRTQNQRQRREQAIAAEIVDLDLVQGTGARRASAPPYPVLAIGRASCGEGGGQDVEVREVAGALKKKT